MRILLTNDDGINAPGLQALERVARTLTDDIWIIAPELEQSGVGHSRTLNAPLRMRQLDNKRFAVNGTPTDCIVMATNQVMKATKPDLVISGINYGANLAESITTSGTVAAAIEATLFGIPAIALSQVVDNHGQPAKWSTAEQLAPEVIKQMLVHKWPANVLINVNFPDIDYTDVKGVRITTQAQRINEENLEERIDPRGKKYYWIGGDETGWDDIMGSDCNAIAENYISITPLNVNITDYPLLEEMRHWKF